MKLLVLFKIGIVLSYSLKSEFLRWLYEKGLRDVLLLKHFDLLGVCGAKESNLGLAHQIHYHLND